MLCRKDPCVDGVVESGINGWQYDSGTAFAKYLTEFCASAQRRAEMSQAALESSERFSAEAFGLTVEKLYKSLQQVNVPMASGARW